MLEKEYIEARIINRKQKMEEVRSRTGTSSFHKTKNFQTISIIPDPQVREKEIRCRSTAAYKLRILTEAERCSKQGQIGTLLRRESLYSSNLVTWRHQRDYRTLEVLSPKQREDAKQRNRPISPSYCRT